jgi:hypothetical protein
VLSRYLPHCPVFWLFVLPLLKSLSPYWPAGLVFALQMLQVLLFGAHYDLDIHYYTTGLTNPDLQHPPLYGALLSVLRHLWPSVYLPVFIQVMAYALAAGWLIRALPKWHLALALALGIAPVASYYNLALMSDGLHCAFLLATAGALLRLPSSYSTGLAMLAGLFMALAVLTRHAAWFYLPGALLCILYTAHSTRERLIQVSLLVLPCLAAFLFQHFYLQATRGASFQPTSGRLLFDNVSAHYQMNDAPNPSFARRAYGIQWGKLEAFPQRFHTGRQLYAGIVQDYQQLGLSPVTAMYQADEDLKAAAQRILAREGLSTLYAEFLQENLRRAITDNALDYRHSRTQDSLLTTEWAYTDAMMLKIYGFSRSEPATLAPWWRSNLALDLYTGLLLLAGVFLLVLGMGDHLLTGQALTLSLLGLPALLVHLFGFIPWQLRFAYPALLFCALGVAVWFMQRTTQPANSSEL